MIIENANLHADVHRLRVENKELLKRVRYSDNNAHMMKVSLLVAWDLNRVDGKGATVAPHLGPEGACSSKIALAN